MKFAHHFRVQQVTSAMSLYRNLRHKLQTSTAALAATHLPWNSHNHRPLPRLPSNIHSIISNPQLQSSAFQSSSLRSNSQSFTTWCRRGSIAFLHGFLQFLFLLISSCDGLTRLAKRGRALGDLRRAATITVKQVEVKLC